MFITLTNATDSNIVIIMLNAIRLITPCNDFEDTIIEFNNGDSVAVSESVQEIQSKLAKL
jgi:hypothetical protein